MNTAVLFSQHRSLNNRMVMAPMTRSRAIGNIPNQMMATYYAQRASAGLIVTEGTAPSANGLGYVRIPGIFNKEQIDGWKLVTKAVQERGGTIFVQLMHTGRVAHSGNMPANSTILAPSAVSANADMWTDTQGMQKTEVPQSMTAQDIQTSIAEFVQAAKNAVEAGFDGVELHAANGYLLEQFLNPHSNNRTDEYGGNPHNRSRFVIEVAQAVVNAIGAEKVGLRISPYGTFNTMPHYAEITDTYNHLSVELSRLNLTYLHVVDYAARTSEEGILLLQQIRKDFKNTIILNGGYTKERAIAALENNEADLISFGSMFLSNPDLPEKFKNGTMLNTPDANTFYTADATGYIDYV